MFVVIADQGRYIPRQSDFDNLALLRMKRGVVQVQFRTNINNSITRKRNYDVIYVGGSCQDP